jgi:hypothetical protein
MNLEYRLSFKSKEELTKLLEEIENIYSTKLPMLHRVKLAVLHSIIEKVLNATNK